MLYHKLHGLSNLIVKLKLMMRYLNLLSDLKTIIYNSLKNKGSFGLPKLGQLYSIFDSKQTKDNSLSQLTWLTFYSTLKPLLRSWTISSVKTVTLLMKSKLSSKNLSKPTSSNPNNKETIMNYLSVINSHKEI